MDKNSDKLKNNNQSNNKVSTSKCNQYKKNKNKSKSNSSCQASTNNECDTNKTDNLANSSNVKQDLKLYQFSYADYVLLSSTIAYAIGEDLNDADLDILISFFGMITSDLAILRTRRGIIQGLAKAKSTNTGVDGVIGATESTQASESIAANLSRNLQKQNNTKKRKKKMIRKTRRPKHKHDYEC